MWSFTWPVRVSRQADGQTRRSARFETVVSTELLCSVNLWPAHRNDHAPSFQPPLLVTTVIVAMNYLMKRVCQEMIFLLRCVLPGREQPVTPKPEASEPFTRALELSWTRTAAH